MAMNNKKLEQEISWFNYHIKTNSITKKEKIKVSDWALQIDFVVGFAIFWWMLAKYYSWHNIDNTKIIDLLRRHMTPPKQYYVLRKGVRKRWHLIDWIINSSEFDNYERIYSEAEDLSRYIELTNEEKDRLTKEFIEQIYDMIDLYEKNEITVEDYLKKSLNA